MDTLSRLRRYRFGPFVLDKSERQLLHSGARVDLQPKVIELIAYLVAHPGALIDREELLAAVWPDAYVSDAALSQMLRRARAALGDDARAPKWIETVYGRGYRFIGQVDVEHADPGDPSDADTPWPDRDRFVGRTADLAALDALWDAGARRVVVAGPGGMGKTRLCTEHLRRSAARWSFTAHADLTPIRTANGLCSAVAAALGISLSPGTEHDAIVQVGHALAHRGEGLVLLDNFEQLVPQGLDSLTEWAELAPETRWLVTTRVRLDRSDESLYELSGLPPDDALTLFRIRAAAAGARLEAHWDPTITALTGELDRLPLAIELAAARAPLLDPRSMRARLTERITLLEGRLHGPERHRSIHAAIAWSWDLLPLDHQRVLACCGLFVGTFSAEMVEAVIGEGSALSALHALLRHSLLQSDPTTAGRLRLAQSVADFAASKIAPDDPAHARFVTRMLEVAADVERLFTEWDADLYRAVLPDIDNLDAARKCTDDPIAAIQLDIARAHLLLRQWRFGDARVCSERVGAQVVTDPRLRARVAILQVRVAHGRGLARKLVARLADAMNALDRDRDAALVAGCAHTLVSAYLNLGDSDAAYQTAIAGLEVARHAGDDGYIAAISEEVALVCYLDGRIAEAERWVEDGLASCPPDRHPQSRVMLLGLKAYLAAQAGRYEEAVHGTLERIALAERHALHDAASSGRVNLASVLQEAGRFAEALEVQDQMLAHAAERGALHQRGQLLINRALTHLHLGNLGTADADLTLARTFIAPEAVQHRTLIEMNTASLEAVRGRFDRCLEHTERALALMSDHPSALYVAAIRMWRIVAEIGRRDLEAARSELSLARNDDVKLPTQVSEPLALLAKHLSGEDDHGIERSIPLVRLVERALSRVDSTSPRV